MFISNSGLQILIEFLDLNFEENRDLVMLAIDSFRVIFDEQTNLQITKEDLSALLTRMGALENLTSVIVSLFHNLETSTSLVDQTNAEKYLERAFEMLANILCGPTEVKVRMCTLKPMQENLGTTYLITCVVKVVSESINDPSPLTFTLIKRFIKIMQIVT